VTGSQSVAGVNALFGTQAGRSLTLGQDIRGAHRRLHVNLPRDSPRFAGEAGQFYPHGEWGDHDRQRVRGPVRDREADEIEHVRRWERGAALRGAVSAAPRSHGINVGSRRSDSCTAQWGLQNGPDGKLHEHEVAYTFGVTPL